MLYQGALLGFYPFFCPAYAGFLMRHTISLSALSLSTIVIFFIVFSGIRTCNKFHYYGLTGFGLQFYWKFPCHFLTQFSPTPMPMVWVFWAHFISCIWQFNYISRAKYSSVSLSSAGTLPCWGLRYAQHQPHHCFHTGDLLFRWGRTDARKRAQAILSQKSSNPGRSRCRDLQFSITDCALNWGTSYLKH